MALPKRRHSNTRTKKRRTHYSIELPMVVACSNCHTFKLPHRVCPKCGYYAGRPVMRIKAVSDKPKNAVAK